MSVPMPGNPGMLPSCAGRMGTMALTAIMPTAVTPAATMLDAISDPAVYVPAAVMVP